MWCASQMNGSLLYIHDGVSIFSIVHRNYISGDEIVCNVTDD
jgi:hypothetical protein